MINIERFFELQFDDPNINRQQLRKFTEDHLKRMAVNNDKNLYGPDDYRHAGSV